MALPPQPDPGPDDESALVRYRYWQREQLFALGFTEADVELLIANGADHHRVRRILDRGCPLDVAARILV